MPDPATDDIIPLRILSLLPASNLMSVVRDFSNHSYMRAYISSAYYFENASYKNSIHLFISSLPLLFVISIIRKISWLLKKECRNVVFFLFSLSFFFVFHALIFRKQKYSRLEKILSSSRLLIFILRRL